MTVINPGQDESIVDSTEPEPQDTELSIDESVEETDSLEEGSEELPEEGADEETALEEGEEEEVEEEEDLDEETIEQFSAAYKDRLLETEVVKKTIAEQVKSELNRQRTELERTQADESAVNARIAQGRQALSELTGSITAVSGELQKAAKGEEIDPSKLNPQALMGNVRDYGNSVMLVTEGRYDRALQAGFEDSIDVSSLNDDDAAELRNIFNTVDRMKGDDKQRARATDFLVTGLFKYVADKAFKQGQTTERTAGESRKTLKDKVTSRTAMKQATAKVAKKKAIPNVKGKTKAEPQGAISMEAYIKAQDAGDVKEMDRIVNEAMRQGIPLND
jgi:hypothetical protein